MDADQGGSDFIDSLPTPEIKTTEDLIAAITPVAPTPKPTDAMLRGKEMSQTQFEGMEPVYDSSPQLKRSGQKGALLGYKFPYSQVQDPGMVASYSAPVYGPHNNLVDPGGKFLGYQVDTSKTYDAPKSAEILALEKKFGTTMDPVYATYKRDTRGGQADVEYGLPIGYRFDNGKSQYVSYDAAGNYIGIQNRESGGFGNVLLSVLAIAYPPIAPFVQMYNAVKALDSGDTLGFLLSAAGASTKLPGLDASTVKLLNDVSTGARVIQAVASGDPLKLLSATASIPGVDSDLKDLSIVLNTAKALNDGNIAGAINGFVKISNQNSLTNLTNKFTDIANGTDVASLNLTTDAGGDVASTDDTDGADTNVAALATSQINALGGTPRYVPLQSVDAGNPNAVAASDALSALIEKNGVQEGATIGPVLVRSEEQDVLDADGNFVLNPDGTKQTELVFSYYSDIKLIDNQGNITGYRALYDPVTGKTAYQLLTSNGETSTSRLTQTPPFFNVDTGRYTDEKPITQVLDDAGVVSDDSVDIIKDLEALTTTPVDALTTKAVDALTTTPVDALTTTSVDALTTTPVDALTTTDLTPLTTTDLIPLTTKAVDALTTKAVDALTTKAIDALTTKAVDALTTKAVDALTTTDIAPLTTTKATTEAYNAAKTAADKALAIATKREPLDLRYDVNKDGKVTSADALSLMKGTPVRSDITASGVKTTTTDVSALTTTDVSSLNTAGPAALTSSGVSSLSTAGTAALTTGDLTSLSTSGTAALTTGDLTSLSTAGTGLSTQTIGALGTKDISSLTTKGVATLATKDLSVLGTKDLSVLATKDLSVLGTKAVTALTTQGVVALPKLPGSTTTTTTGTSTTTKPTTPATAEAAAADAYVDKLVKAGTGFDPSAEFNPYWFSEYQKHQKATKIASGGYLDGLLANPTSFEELLRTLRS